MLSKFIKRLAAAVVVSHIAITTGLHYYGKKKQNGQTDDLEDTEVKGQATKPEEDKLLAWLSYLNGIPLIKDIAKNTKQLNRKLTVRDDDVYIISYPKSGTTWLSEMVFNIVHDMDIIRSKETRLDQRVPYIEWVGTDLSELDLLEKQDRRVFKSHLPLVLLPEKIKSSPCKIIYIMCNPRDVAVSYYHFTKMVKPVSYKGEFADFFELFLTGRVAYGDWCGHVTDYWQLAQSESQQHRVMFLSYEEMSENPVEVARRLSIFLEQPMDEFKLKILAHFCSFNKMKGNPSANYDWLEQSHFKVKGVPFLRKGIVGDWKNHLNSDMVQALNSKVDEKIQDSDLKEVIKYV